MSEYLYPHKATAEGEFSDSSSFLACAYRLLPTQVEVPAQSRPFDKIP